MSNTDQEGHDVNESHSKALSNNKKVIKISCEKFMEEF